MKAVIIFIFSLFFLSDPLFSRLPFSISDETSFHFDLDEGATCLENELVLEKEFDILYGLTFSAENLYMLDDLEQSIYADEVTFGSSINVLNFLGTGAAHRIFIFQDQDMEHGLDLSVFLSYELEDLELCMEDENEFIYNYSTDNWTYINTLGIDKNIYSLTDFVNLSFYLENEYVDGFLFICQAEDSLKTGPVLNFAHWALALYYTSVLLPEYRTGIEAGLLVQF